MRIEHTREEDDSIKVCLSVGHLRVCGWAASWKEIAPTERLLHRLLEDNGRVPDTQSI